jgi:hypothetical protein
MGMRVGGAASSAAMSAWQSRRQEFGSLVSAIKGGDLNAAQQAFAQLSGATPSSSTTSSSSTTGTSSTTNNNSPLAAVGQALSSGDIKAAQQALANMFANGPGRGHHHHHGGNSSSVSPQATNAQSSPSGSTVSVMA